MEAPSILLRAWDALLELPSVAAGTAVQMLLSPGSSYSLIGLGITVGIAAAFTLGRRRGKRAVPLRVLIRALLPRRMWRSASGRADAAFALFNIFVGMLLFGWAILGQVQVAAWTAQALSGGFGHLQLFAWPALAVGALATLALFLAYEFAYWLDHYLSHKLPFLWQFHQVHHSAESLSLATIFRVHPVDTIVFYNLVALFTGLTAGVLNYAFGEAAAPFTIGGGNVLLLGTAVLLTHLHHTHFWISFGDRWGRMLLSPAHHQIHHSADPAHYDRNFGNSLAIFDRLFGTLYVPAAKREQLSFGVPELDYDPHSFARSFWMPCVSAATLVRDRLLALVSLPARGSIDAA